MRFSKPAIIFSLTAVLMLSACGSSSKQTTTTTSTTSSSTTSTSVATTAPAADECTTADLTISAVSGDAGAGNRYITMALQNSSTSQCTLNGYVGMAAYNGTTAVVSNVTRTGPAPAAINLQPSQRGYFDMHYVVVPTNNEKCGAITKLEVTPPDQTTQLILPLTNISISELCTSSGISVTAVRATQNA